MDYLAYCKLMTGFGSFEEAVSLEQQALRLSPRDPYIRQFFYGRIGLFCLQQGRIDEAIGWLEKARSGRPSYAGYHAYLASAYALKGELDRASAELSEAERLAPDGRYSSIARVKAAGTVGGPGYWGVPKVAALFEATYLAGLRKAGMPEE
jgi:tetratricopeptide (TPR) repeat protein